MSLRRTSYMRRGQAALTAALCFLFAPIAAQSAIRSGTWTGDFSIPAFDGRVAACAIYQGGYYVAGDFQWAGAVSVSNVARWTGDRWVAPGGGLPRSVNRLTPWGTELLAATSSNGDGFSPVMRFDGYSWRSLGPPLYGTAEALLAQGADLYVAGSLFQPGLENSYRVMRWDGTAWQPVGGSFDGRILSLGLYQGELYAGGEFLTAEDHFVSRIARWDGAHWQAVGGGTNAGAGVAVNAFAVYGGRMIAGGYFSQMGSLPARGVAAWNGAEWDSLPGTPTDCFVTDLLVEDGDLHVAGVLQVPNQWASGFATFDGQTFRVPSPYPDWGIQDIAAADGSLIAVGHLTALQRGAPAYDSAPARDVVVRDPTWRTLFAWTPTMRGLLGPGATSVAALHAHEGQLYAGGYFWNAATPSGWTSTHSLAQWKNDGWEPVGADELVGWVQAIGSYGDRLVVGGSGFTAGAAHSSVLTWDGARWSDLGSVLEGWIAGVAEWQGALVAAGGVRTLGQQNWSAVAVHRGVRWETLGEPLVSDQTSVSDVAVYRGELYVAGTRLSGAAGTSALMRWDGNRWVPVPGTPDANARSLLPREDGLWVAFGHAADGGSVRRWDGRQWTDMGLVGDVARLAEAQGEVFAGGWLSIAPQPVSLARWDGAGWVAIPAGPFDIESMASLGNDLWVGGWFRHTEQQQSEGLARWSFTTDAPVPPVALSISTWPSPAHDLLSFRLTLPREGRVSITLHDLAGARVATAVDEVLPAGYSERSWAIPAQRMPAGVYFARAEGPGVSWSGRVVVVR